MILVDTNVISELWRIIPNENVLNWMNAQPIETLYLSSITFAELCLGIASMPEGKRRTTYKNRLDNQVLPAFKDRVLSFNLDASKIYADLIANSMTKGRSIGKEDGYIAAIAATHGFSVATRDVSPFEAAGLTVINPWQP